MSNVPGPQSLARQPAGELRPKDAGRRVRLQGWVGRRRDLGELIFLTVRDRSGTVQVLFDRLRCPLEAVAGASEARSEDVVDIEGEVALRGEGRGNAEQATGEIEVIATRVAFLARSDTPPFQVEDRTNAAEDLRLEYRYLDLRRPAMLRNFVLRDEIVFRVRKILHEKGFLEVETPMLTRSTPEGARDFLVPSRVHPGQFYALPQSPQIFKQILMVAGFERYFQIARCFRDEDLRADRQPEFTQIDIEMSFPTEEDVFAVVEALLADAFAAAGIACEPPFPRLTHSEALELYGTDRPDLRFGLPLVRLDGVARGTGFAPFDKALAGRGGAVRGLRVPGGAAFSRKKLDELTEEAKRFGAGGLLWIKRAEGEITSPAKKHLSPEALSAVIDAAGVEEGDLLLIVADREKAASAALGALRLRAARELDLLDETRYRFCWVTDFPLLEWDDAAGRWFATHHPFTSPREEDLGRLEDDPGTVRARAYDVVLNGTELGGGSIRIHRADVQRRVFQSLGISEDEAREKFGFLLDALRFGAPPHGGIALGVDRICMLAAGASSIRDVIAFPKTTSGTDLMSRAPSAVSGEQLRELGIAVLPPGKS
ncbi:MAG: aspartate--tRNA ligase [Acidobacteria bacterium]|nr:aspartate--tRNA ligase [Acidobacteriota bacterium]MCA1611668.1 aspartate--tRNA ligase [Acidobacteriota bacterium]